jgi:transcription elongation factor Elf1
MRVLIKIIKARRSDFVKNEFKCSGCGTLFSSSDIEVMEIDESSQPIYCDLCELEINQIH